MAKVLFISTSLIKAQSVIEENTDDKVLAKTIDNVQNIQLKPILGDELFTYLSGEVAKKSADETYVLTEADGTLIKDYIQPFLTYAVIAEFITINTFKISNKGIQKLNDSTSLAANSSDLEYIKNYYDNFTSSYKSVLIKFLQTQKLIPNNADTDITSNSIGWYLENTNACGTNNGNYGTGSNPNPLPPLSNEDDPIWQAERNNYYLKTDIDLKQATQGGINNDLQDQITNNDTDSHTRDNAESTARIAGDTNLQNQVTTNNTNSISRDTSETNARIAADGVENAARILADNNEVTARTSADTNLQSQVTTNNTDSISRNDAEVTARTNADINLQNQVNLKAADNAVMHLTTSETATGTKTLSDPYPLVLPNLTDPAASGLGFVRNGGDGVIYYRTQAETAIDLGINNMVTLNTPQTISGLKTFQSLMGVGFSGLPYMNMYADQNTGIIGIGTNVYYDTPTTAFKYVNTAAYGGAGMLLDMNPSGGFKICTGTYPAPPTTKFSVSLTGTVAATQYKLSALNTAPVSSEDSGTLGEIRITAGYIYVCSAPNTWVRTTLTTWTESI